MARALLCLSLFLITCSSPLRAGDNRPSPGKADPGEIQSLVERLADPGKKMNWETISRLEIIGSPAVEPLLELLSSERTATRLSAARVLGGIKDGRAVEPLVGILGDPDRNVRWQAVNALEKIGWPSVAPLLEALESGDPTVRREAARTLGRLEDPRAIEPLIKALGDDYPEVRFSAASALGRFSDARATGALGEQAVKSREISKPPRPETGTPVISPGTSSRKEEKSEEKNDEK